MEKLTIFIDSEIKELEIKVKNPSYTSTPVRTKSRAWRTLLSQESSWAMWLGDWLYQLPSKIIEKQGGIPGMVEWMIDSGYIEEDCRPNRQFMDNGIFIDLWAFPTLIESQLTVEWPMDTIMTRITEKWQAYMLGEFVDKLL